LHYTYSSQLIAINIAETVIRIAVGMDYVKGIARQKKLESSSHLTAPLMSRAVSLFY